MIMIEYRVKVMPVNPINTQLHAYKQTSYIYNYDNIFIVTKIIVN